MKLVSKFCIKYININIKIFFIIFLLILFLKLYKIKIINQIIENIFYFRENKINKEKKLNILNKKEKKLNFGIYSNNNDQDLKKVKKVGVIGLKHQKNIGNNVLKFARYIQLKELGLKPYIIGIHMISQNIRFLNNTTHLRIIKDFNEIKKK